MILISNLIAFFLRPIRVQNKFNQSRTSDRLRKKTGKKKKIKTKRQPRKSAEQESVEKSTNEINPSLSEKETRKDDIPKQLTTNNNLYLFVSSFECLDTRYRPIFGILDTSSLVSESGSRGRNFGWNHPRANVCIRSWGAFSI